MKYGGYFQRRKLENIVNRMHNVSATTSSVNLARALVKLATWSIKRSVIKVRFTKKYTHNAILSLNVTT